MNENKNFNPKPNAKPILKWAGGKTSTLPLLINYFPNNFNRYIEPFVGGGAVFLSLEKQMPIIINDVNPELVNLYSVIQNSTDELCQILNEYKLNYSEEFYYQLRNQKFENKNQMAARTIFLNKTGFNGLFRQNLKGEFNVPFGKRSLCPTLYNIENLKLVSQKLKSAHIYKENFETIFSMCKKGDFIYCDPPYEPLSKTSSFNQYNGNKFTQDDQKKLLQCAMQACQNGATIAISNSSAPFILELYKNFKIHKIPTRRSINSNGLKRNKIDEVLIILDATEATQ